MDNMSNFAFIQIAEHFQLEKSKTMISLTRLCLLTLGVFTYTTNGHIRVMEPPNRSSLWRDPRFAEFNPPNNTNDAGVYCGGILQPLVPVNCGVCGDPLAETVPRPNEHGGLYGQGVISGRYRVGQEIPFSVEVTTPHNGSFHFQLCENVPESNDCFMGKPFLEMTTVKGLTSTEIPITGTSPFWVNGTMKLPAGVTCRNCVLRLNYRSGLIGDCDDGSRDYGCGLQQNFRSCSDISITL